jgi:hypothetical protein
LQVGNRRLDAAELIDQLAGREICGTVIEYG